MDNPLNTLRTKPIGYWVRCDDERRRRRMEEPKTESHHAIVIFSAEHIFEETERGILMTDRVSYKLPYGVLGRLLHPVIVKKQVKKIFNFRFKTLENYFN